MPWGEREPSSTTGCFTDASKQGCPRFQIPIQRLAVSANFKVLEGRGIGCVARSPCYQTSISDRVYVLEGFVFAVGSLQ